MSFSISISKDAPSPRDILVSAIEQYAKGPQLWEALLKCYVTFYEKMTEEECLYIEKEFAEDLLSLMTCIDRGLTHASGKEHRYSNVIDIIRSSIYNTVESKKRFQQASASKKLQTS